MKLDIKHNQGYVIIDDNTGEILDTFVETEIGFDNKMIESYRRDGEKHFRL